jgi:general secretion pathway protein G
MNESTRVRRCPRDRFPCDQGGFTLIEIMVVIVILGLLATLVVPSVLGASDEAKVQKARTDVHTIADAVRMYKIRNNKTPNSIEELTQPDAKGKPFIEDVGKDPWDHEYVIHDLERGDFEVISLGPDGNEGTEDDISSKRSKDK